MTAVSFTADRDGLCVRVSDPLPHSAVSLAVDGRTVWSFRMPVALIGATPEHDAFVPWPPELAARLTGWAKLSLTCRGARIADEKVVVFTDSGVELTLRDALTGQPLVINKWQRIAKSFEGRENSLIEDLLDRSEELISLVASQMGLSLFVTGGTLLGPVRDGRIMPHDDDADLAYLSVFDNPSDVALESFSLERMLLASGYEVIRLSAGHLQIMFPGASLTDDFYIDVFAYFVCGGWFHGTFHAREPAHTVPILPLRPLQVGSRELPGPVDPPALLSAIYGPEWRTPDPAFTFITPPAALRRYRGWLSDVNMDREAWEQQHREVIGSGNMPGASDFARRVVERIGAASRILELGCAFGSDTRLLAGAGHQLLGVDYSRPALVYAQSQQTPGDGTEFRRANLSSVRDLVGLAAGCSRPDQTTHVFARSVFDALGREATETTLALVSSVLNDPRSRAHVEFVVGNGQSPAGWTERRGVDIGEFTDALRRRHLVIDEKASVPTRGGGTQERVQLTLKKEVA